MSLLLMQPKRFQRRRYRPKANNALQVTSSPLRVLPHLNAAVERPFSGCFDRPVLAGSGLVQNRPNIAVSNRYHPPERPPAISPYDITMIYGLEKKNFQTEQVFWSFVPTLSVLRIYWQNCRILSVRCSELFLRTGKRRN
jgi:hypothetical protein